MSDLRTTGKIALKTVILPHELNANGTAFGGAMLGYLDLAGAEMAMQRCKSKVALVAVEHATFCAPVRINDVFEIYGAISREGNTSLAVDLEIWRNCPARNEDFVKAGSGRFVYVALNEQLHPHSINPGSRPQTEAAA